MVPGGFSEGIRRGVRKALGRLFFASPGHGMKNAKTSEAFYLSGEAALLASASTILAKRESFMPERSDGASSGKVFDGKKYDGTA